MEKEVLFDITHLQKYFPIRKGFLKKHVGDVKAVDDVSVTVYKNETLGIVGESGCGKTTFGKSIMLLDTPTGGEVLFHDRDGAKDITKMNAQEQLHFRKRVQMVFQDPYNALNPLKKIIESFEGPLKLHGIKDKAEREEIMREVLRVVNTNPDYLYRYPHEFSGGQRQRLCIARALEVGPEVLVCDEPVSALDVSIQAQVLNLMKKIQRERKLTYLFIAHDLSVVQYMSDRIMVMYLGHVMEIADSRALYDHPAHPYTEALLSAIPVPVRGAKKKRIILEGDVASPINKPPGCVFHTRCRKCMERCKQEVPVMREIAPGHRVACHLYDGAETVTEPKGEEQTE
ncbi:MAG: ATP-binding cassette domain-containing protein [Lachnospiraceae bacterium]|nr:ATP-binding cassette domain-containing protein [Lachnospiraceae bacterium]